MSLKVYEEKLQEHQIKKEEKQILLMHAIETNKDMGENSRWCERWRNRGCRRGCGRSNGDNGYEGVQKI